MANFGFSTTPTPAHVFKVVGQDGDWSQDVRLNCYLAAASGSLSDNVATTFFDNLLGKMGIARSKPQPVLSGKVVIDVYSASGIVKSEMSDFDMQVALSGKLFPTTAIENKPWLMIAGVTGEALTSLYNQYFKASKDAPFVMYRITVGQYVIYRVTNDDTNLDSLARQAIKYLVDTSKIPEKEWINEVSK